jgi:hypothetical protein
MDELARIWKELLVSLIEVLTLAFPWRDWKPPRQDSRFRSRESKRGPPEYDPLPARVSGRLDPSLGPVLTESRHTQINGESLLHFYYIFVVRSYCQIPDLVY